MLPPEVFKKAAANIKQQGWTDYDIETQSLATALRCAFRFDTTPEGRDYWCNQVTIAPQTENREVK